MSTRRMRGAGRGGGGTGGGVYGNPQGNYGQVPPRMQNARDSQYYQNPPPGFQHHPQNIQHGQNYNPLHQPQFHQHLQHQHQFPPNFDHQHQFPPPNLQQLPPHFEHQQLSQIPQLSQMMVLDASSTGTQQAMMPQQHFGTWPSGIAGHSQYGNDRHNGNLQPQQYFPVSQPEQCSPRQGATPHQYGHDRQDGNHQQYFPVSQPGQFSPREGATPRHPNYPLMHDQHDESFAQHQSSAQHQSFAQHQSSSKRQSSAQHHHSTPSSVISPVGQPPAQQYSTQSAISPVHQPPAQAHLVQGHPSTYSHGAAADQSQQYTHQDSNRSQDHKAGFSHTPETTAQSTTGGGKPSLTTPLKYVYPTPQKQELTSTPDYEEHAGSDGVFKAQPVHVPEPAHYPFKGVEGEQSESEVDNSSDYQSDVSSRPNAIPNPSQERHHSTDRAKESGHKATFSVGSCHDWQEEVRETLREGGGSRGGTEFASEPLAAQGIVTLSPDHQPPTEAVTLLAKSHNGGEVQPSRYSTEWNSQNPASVSGSHRAMHTQSQVGLHENRHQTPPNSQFKHRQTVGETAEDYNLPRQPSRRSEEGSQGKRSDSVETRGSGRSSGRRRPGRRGSAASGSLASTRERDEKPTELLCEVPGCGRKFVTSSLPVDYVMPGDVGDYIKGKEKKKIREKELSAFFNIICALLNSGGGGMVYLHVQTKMLHFLYEQLDDMLMRLIPPDGTKFSDNYVSKIEDANHVSIRVKHRDRMMSTKDFKTKLSMNKGLADPTSLQMLRLLKRSISTAFPSTPGTAARSNAGAHPSSSQSTRDRLQYPFNLRDLVQNNDIPSFHENTEVEAKSVKRNQGNIRNATDLVKHACKDLKLLERVSAFSKEELGGGYFLGVGEEHVAPNSDERTGKFLCEGVELPAGETDKIEGILEAKIASEMLLWYPENPEVPFPPPPRVKVTAHSVASSPTTHPMTSSSLVSGRGQASTANSATTCSYVVEILVRNFPGVAFTDPEGPEAYTFQHPDNANLGKAENKENSPPGPLRGDSSVNQTKKLKRVSQEEWFEKQLQAVNSFAF